MNHLKILGLLAMAAASLMAFASSAWANPILTRSAGVAATELHATLESGTSILLKAGISTTCTESTVKWTIETNNTEHAAGSSVWSFGKCTKHTTVTAGGNLTVNDKGEVFAYNNIFHTVDTSLGVTCNYGGGPSPGTKLGVVEFGTTAKLKVNTEELPKLAGSNFFCASKAAWSATYIVTTPDTLFLT